ncbi:HipA N-terminal domain-containing protein [Phyllobacterium sp. 22229]|uniref:HipA N-terminal domain-containing protein n=1 Tax=Agrobacterium radiobacter TaxID=362 RepID=A0ABD5LQ22_AGRRD
MPEALVALGEQKIEIGRLLFESDGRRQHSTFIYAESWLRHPQAFALSPGFPLTPVPFHASGQSDMRDALGGPFADAAPDSWGRRLMARELAEGISTGWRGRFQAEGITGAMAQAYMEAFEHGGMEAALSL